jgi:hypothetical protein
MAIIEGFLFYRETQRHLEPTPEVIYIGASSNAFDGFLLSS